MQSGVTITDIADKTAKWFERNGFREKNIRVPYIVRNKSRYDPHVGAKEKAKAAKRAEEMKCIAPLQESKRLPL